MKTDVVAVIPARHGARRLPGKPLLSETGKPLIQHVYERAMAAGLPRVIVATDDRRVLNAVRRFGGEAVLTSRRHPSGTDRAAEVARSLSCRWILNLQGDEPEIAPGILRGVVALLEKNPRAEMATWAVPLKEPRRFFSVRVVKVIRDLKGRALYFSRSPVPRLRDGEPAEVPPMALHHVGVYGYRRDALLALARLAPTTLEEAEHLEQLRALQHGYTILVGVGFEASPGIDTPDDYRAFVERWRTSDGNGKP